MGFELIPLVLVPDSWPILEWLKGREPASRKFETILSNAENGVFELVMCRLNFGEATYIIRKSPAFTNRDDLLRTLRELPMHRYSVDDALVDGAVELKSIYPISYADAFAAALAIHLRAPLVTGDKEFLTLSREGKLQLHWVGE